MLSCLPGPATGLLGAATGLPYMFCRPARSLPEAAGGILPRLCLIRRLMSSLYLIRRLTHAPPLRAPRRAPHTPSWARFEHLTRPCCSHGCRPAPERRHQLYAHSRCPCHTPYVPRQRAYRLSTARCVARHVGETRSGPYRNLLDWLGCRSGSETLVVVVTRQTTHSLTHSCRSVHLTLGTTDCKAVTREAVVTLRVSTSVMKQK